MITLILSLIFSQTSIPYVSASEETTYFARIMQEDVYLYKSPTDINQISNIYFELPKTYFVELLDSANNDFYKAKYQSFTGYVKKESVQAIVGTPENPYLKNISFRVYAELSRDLRTEPNTSSQSSNQVAYIPLLSKNLTYYGTVKGECLIEGRTDKWYYCKYSGDKDYYGYVYSDFCDELTKIKDNTETVTYTANPEFKKAEPEQTTFSTSDNFVGIIVGILSIPALIFVLMIIKSKRILTKDRLNDKEIKDY